LKDNQDEFIKRRKSSDDKQRKHYTISLKRKRSTSPDDYSP